VGNQRDLYYCLRIILKSPKPTFCPLRSKLGTKLGKIGTKLGKIGTKFTKIRNQTIQFKVNNLIFINNKYEMCFM
jgi:hypothetical protein